MVLFTYNKETMNNCYSDWLSAFTIISCHCFQEQGRHLSREEMEKVMICRP